MEHLSPNGQDYDLAFTAFCIEPPWREHLGQVGRPVQNTSKMVDLGCSKLESAES